MKKDLLFLMGKNVGQIKLVDRTFNYDAQRAGRIWEFILEHNRGSHFHFEIAADLLSDAALDLLKQVPADTFRFEIGVQSASATTLEQVNRKTDLGRLFYVIRRLRAETRPLAELAECVADVKRIKATDEYKSQKAKYERLVGARASVISTLFCPSRRRTAGGSQRLPVAAQRQPRSMARS